MPRAASRRPKAGCLQRRPPLPPECETGRAGDLRADFRLPHGTAAGVSAQRLCPPAEDRSGGGGAARARAGQRSPIRQCSVQACRPGLPDHHLWIGHLARPLRRAAHVPSWPAGAAASALFSPAPQQLRQGRLQLRLFLDVRLGLALANPAAKIAKLGRACFQLVHFGDGR